MQQIPDHAARIEAALVGVCVGEAQADEPAGAADLLGVAESLAATGAFDAEDLRKRGLERPSKSGSTGLLLRGMPFGLLTPFDRPRLRRDAYRCVSLAGADEATVITAVAVAVLTADLMRFDLETSLVRLRQSLLEDAPFALLERFRIPQGPADPGVGHDPGAVFQAAAAALHEAQGLVGCAQAALATSPVTAGLAAALAGTRDGFAGVDAEAVRAVPHAETASAIARRLAEQAGNSSLAGVGAP